MASDIFDLRGTVSVDTSSAVSSLGQVARTAENVFSGVNFKDASNDMSQFQKTMEDDAKKRRDTKRKNDARDMADAQMGWTDLKGTVGDIWKDLSRFPRAAQFTVDKLQGNYIDIETKFDQAGFQKAIGEGQASLDSFADSFSKALDKDVQDYSGDEKKMKAAYAGAASEAQAYRKALEDVRKQARKNSDGSKESIEALKKLDASYAKAKKSQLGLKAKSGIKGGGVYANEDGLKKLASDVIPKIGEAWEGVYDLAASKAKEFNVAAKLVEKAPPGYFEMRQQLTQLGASFGHTKDQMNATVDGIIDMSTELGVSFSDLSALEGALLKTGTSLSDLDEKSKKAAATLHGVYGIPVDDIHQINSATQFMDVSLGELTDTAVEFQQKYQIPGLLQETQRVTEATEGAIIKYGAAFVGQGKEMTTSVLSSGAAIAKAFTITAQEGIQKATAQIAHFQEEMFNLHKLTIGLGDGLSEMGTALLASGMANNLGDVKALLKEGAKGGLEFAEKVKKGLDNVTDPTFRERLRIQITEGLDETTRALINQPKAYKGAIKAREDMLALNKKSGGRVKALDDFTKQFRNSFIDLGKAFSDLLLTSKVIVFDLFGKDAEEMMDGAISAVRSLNESLQGMFKSMKDPDSAYSKYLKPLLIGAAKASMVLAGAFGVLAGAMAMITTGFVGVTAMIAPLKLLSKGIGKLRGKIVGATESISAWQGAMKGATKPIGKMAGKVGGKSIFGKAITWISKSFGSLGKMFAGGRFVKPLLKSFKILGTKIPVLNIVIGAIFGVYTAFKTIKEVFDDPDAKGLDKFVAIVKGTLYGLLDFLDSTFLFGMGGLIKDFFFADLADSVDKGFTAKLKKFFSSLKLMDYLLLMTPLAPLVLINHFFPLDKIMDSMSKALDKLGLWMVNEMPGMVESASASIGEAFGSLARGLTEIVVDGVKGLINGTGGAFDPNSPEGKKMTASGANLMDSLAIAMIRAIGGMTLGVTAAFKGLFVGAIAGALGFTVTEVDAGFELMGIRIAYKLARIMVRAKEWAKELAATAATGFAPGGPLQTSALLAIRLSSGSVEQLKVLDEQLKNEEKALKLRFGLQVVHDDKMKKLAKTRADEAKKVKEAAKKDEKKGIDQAMRRAVQNNDVFQNLAKKARAAILAAKEKALKSTGGDVFSGQAAAEAETKRQTSILKPVEKLIRDKASPEAIKAMAEKMTKQFKQKSGWTNITGTIGQGRSSDGKVNVGAEVPTPATDPKKLIPQRSNGTPDQTKTLAPAVQTSQQAAGGDGKTSYLFSMFKKALGATAPQEVQVLLKLTGGLDKVMDARIKRAGNKTQSRVAGN